MFYTHHFAHRETLSRARAWLSQAGYEPLPDDPNDGGGSPRLVLAIDPRSHAAAALLISAAERSDPDGWPSFWEAARRPHAARRGDHVPDCGCPAGSSPCRPKTAAIGWHPVDPAPDFLPTVH